MKTKNYFLSALLAGAMFMANPSEVKAQFNGATTQDTNAKTFATQVNVQNTGCSQILVDGNKIFRAMVWDGSGGGPTESPSLYVNFNGNTKQVSIGSPSGASKPDVAAYQYSADVVRLLVTYVKGTTVYLHRYDYTISTNSLPANANYTSTVTGATYPNVDVNEVGEGVWVYQKNEEIYAKTITLSQSSPTVTTEFRVDYEPQGFDYWRSVQPDVAIKKNLSGTGSTVSFIYVQQDRNTSYTYSEALITQDAFSAVAAGGSTSNTGGGVGAYGSFSFGPVESPRIATLHAPFLHDKDYVAVVQDGNQIISIGSNDNAASYNLATLNDNNSYPDLTAYSNTKPVVTYSGDYAIVAWTLLDLDDFSDKEIIAKQLSWSGLPLNSGYSVVNYSKSGNQLAPSLSGTLYDPQTLFTFYDENTRSVMFKNSWYSNVNLRQAGASIAKPVMQAEVQLSVYPNPATENSIIEITLQEENQVKALELYNLTGQKVGSYNLSEMSLGKNRLNLHNDQVKNLSKGIYLLKLTTNNSQKVVKVVY